MVIGIGKKLISSSSFDTTPKMYSNKSSKSSNNKRHAFVPADIRKEFGLSVKKPRLDVRLTPLSHSPNKSDANISNKEPGDEIWGEELPEEAIEECELLATQAYQEASVIKSDNTVPVIKSKIVNEPLASTSKDAPKEFWGGSYQVSKIPPQCTSSAAQEKEAVQVSLEPPNNLSISCMKNAMNNIVTLHGSVGKKDDSNFESANKELKERCLQKEGEVAILRSQLKQLQLQLETQKLDNMKSLESQALKFKEQLKEQKKELDVTNTQLQFQIMEATSMRNHCKVLESGTKIKLIEPESLKVETPKKKKEISRNDELWRSSVSNHGCTSTISVDRKFVSEKCRTSLINDMKSILLGVREGAVLGLLVNEYLTAKSEPDISWILYLRKKQSLCRKIKEAEGINSKILMLQKCNQTLESCYSSINKLITLDAISSTAAYFFIETIVKECQRIVCRQMHILHLHCVVQSYAERGTLNGVVASVIGTPATIDNYNLMSAGWYEEEEGMESRRALGLLCALCEISSLASELTYGSKPLTNYSEDVVSKTLHITEDKILAFGHNKKCIKDSHDVCGNERKVMPTTRDKISYTEYLSKPFGFMHLLKDIAFSVSFQRRTRHFVGLLTGIIKLLTAIARSCSLVGTGLELVSEIVRQVVFCRPQLEVVVALFELLSAVAQYPVVMKSLCINSSINTFVDITHIGLTYFTRESCVTQVLFRLLPSCATSISLRTELCYYMVHWLHSFVCFSGNESCWLLTIQENKRVSCVCKETLVSGFVTTLYNSLCDLDLLCLENPTRSKLIESLRKSILFLRVWQQKDEEYWKYFVKENFAYQLWLTKIKRDSIMKTELNDLERNCILELLDKPEENNDIMADTEDDDEYWGIISNDCKVLFIDQR